MVRIMAATYGGTPDIDEDLVEFSPWRFDVGQLRCPLRAWHGDADEIAPIGLVEELIRLVPDAALTIYPGEGHFIDPSHRGDYLSTLTAW